MTYGNGRVGLWGKTMARKIYTHYDNLQISRNASPEVIKAAYRVLCARFHPDIVGQSDDSLKRIKIINRAYEVLSDPVHRKAHDDWIRQAEQLATMTPSETESLPLEANYAKKEPDWTVRFVVFACVGLALTLAFFPQDSGDVNVRRAQAPLELPPEVSSTPSYTRPAYAPNGKDWPEVSGYLDGYRVGAKGGYSDVTINASQSDSDTYVKFIQVSGGQQTTVRRLIVKAGAKFKINGIAPGVYRLYLLDLDTGNYSKSDEIELNENETAAGVSYDSGEITLYKIIDGNFETSPISAAEFGE